MAIIGKDTGFYEPPLLPSPVIEVLFVPQANHCLACSIRGTAMGLSSSENHAAGQEGVVTTSYVGINIREGGLGDSSLVMTLWVALCISV